MDDNRIVQLYWDRNESAIVESSNKYGSYCTSIAHNILQNLSDAEECVNDTWLRAWNAMPPHHPAILSTFFGKITRNLSFDLYRRKNREKRGGGHIAQALEELSECVSGTSSTESDAEVKELVHEIDRFLLALPEEKRYMFVLRYWYADSIPSIAGRLNMSENNVSVSLSRIRGKLKDHLRKKGFTL